jgi:hypothetical protein
MVFDFVMSILVVFGMLLGTPVCGSAGPPPIPIPHMVYKMTTKYIIITKITIRDVYL